MLGVKAQRPSRSPKYLQSNFSTLKMTDSLSTLMAKRTVENVWARSQRQTIECSYEYVIPDLSLLTQKVGEKVDSPLFFVKGNENISSK